jgi:hypothetical protein
MSDGGSVAIEAAEERNVLAKLTREILLELVGSRVLCRIDPVQIVGGCSVLLQLLQELPVQ